MDIKLSLSEVEAKAKHLIQRACPAELMDIETLTTCRETGRVFIVLKCKELILDDSNETGSSKQP